MPVSHRRDRRTDTGTAQLLDESRLLRQQLDQIAPPPVPTHAADPGPTPEDRILDRVQEYLEPHRASFPDSPLHRPAGAAGGIR